MRILFVISNAHAKNWEMNFNFGIAQLSSVLKTAGHKTELILVNSKKDINKIFRYVEKYKTKIIGFSFTVITYDNAVVLAKIIKKKYPNILIIAGGVYCIINPEEIIKQKCFDGVCIGEGDEVIVDLMNALEDGKSIYKINNFWFKKNGKIFKNKINKPTNLDLLPLPDREIFYRNKINFHYYGDSFLKPKLKGGYIILGRGCPFDCNYCSNNSIRNKLGQDYYRLISPQKGIKQIIKIQKKYKYDYLIFFDDTFTVNKKWLEKFIDLYYEKVRVPFHINIRIGTLTKNIFKRLKKAGCYYVRFGLESGSEIIRKKVLNKIITNIQIEREVKWIREAGIKVGTYNMIGIPGENNKYFLETLTLNAKINVDNSIIFIFHPYKGTKLYELCKKEGLIYKNIPKNFEEREDTILKMNDFKRKDILYFYKNFHFLISLLKKGNNPIVNFYNMVLVKFYFIPPSSKYFKITQKIANNFIRLKKILKMRNNILYFLELLWIMTEKELKLRYKYTIFGFLWLLVNPVIQMFVINFIFLFFTKELILNYKYYLFIGLLSWNFFSLSISNATQSIINQRFLIRKSKFPKAVIPLSVIFSNLINFVIALLLYTIIVVLFVGFTNFISILNIFEAIILLILFTIGISLFTSAINVRFRDINFFVQAILLVWFYATPIIYPMNIIPSRFLWIWFLNPMTSVVQLLQHGFLDFPGPDINMLAINVFIIILVLILGIISFDKESANFTDWV